MTYTPSPRLVAANAALVHYLTRMQLPPADTREEHEAGGRQPGNPPEDKGGVPIERFLQGEGGKR
ncbi:MAG: hypothetical protein F9K44_15150 [Hyphomicrobiaceae bacterium]|nr:MAG: hypothetical protein F9K44_15150 [Hyphomicrobiaceae bacterium]